MQNLHYENVRAHEAELLRLAQRHRIATVPARERRLSRYGRRVLDLVLDRRPLVPPKPATQHG